VRKVYLLLIMMCPLYAVFLLSCGGGNNNPTGPEPLVNFTLTGTIILGESGLSGVSVRLSGTSINKTVTTGTEGMYTFSDIPSGIYTLTPSLTGHTFNPPSINTTLTGSDTTVDTFTAQKNNVEIHEIHGISFVSIPGGTFLMGDVESVGYSNEKPVHTVTLAGFEMSTTEITNARYAEYLTDAMKQGEITASTASVKGSSGEYTGEEYINLSGFYNADNKCWIQFVDDTFRVESGKEELPVVFVSWNGAKAFALHYGFDLPTEAEWEYGARSGKDYKYGTCDGTISKEYANYGRNVGYPVDVGSYPENLFGLCDMCGNVWEWCRDWYGMYTGEDANNPSGTETGSHRVPRGGGWFVYESLCRSSVRSGDDPALEAYNLGFRVVRRYNNQ